ncbi:MAG TPA: 3-deoxy-7-phosphoheptulonate synthase, partial [Terriglobales bacterium]|nr:3-deoxy-7-phosphoheptulonate synthase [Terriglobales bacterium]
MKERIEDRNLIEMTPLTRPAEMKVRLPLSERAADVVREARRGIRDIIHGRDRHRLVVVVGPCSIHDLDGARDYARRLQPLAEAVRDHLLVVMRTYFEKPRTTVGWKGLINDPHLDGSCDIATGIELARGLLLEINELGLPCGYEGLDPVTPQYIADLISWAAIGARTT